MNCYHCEFARVNGGLSPMWNQHGCQYGAFPRKHGYGSFSSW